MRVDETAGADDRRRRRARGLVFFVLFGRLSDRIGRKTPIVIGYALTLVLLFPLFWMIGSAANPGAGACREARAGRRVGPGLQLRSVRRPSSRRNAAGCSTISRRRAWPIPRRATPATRGDDRRRAGRRTLSDAGLDAALAARGLRSRQGRCRRRRKSSLILLAILGDRARCRG